MDIVTLTLDILQNWSMVIILAVAILEIIILINSSKEKRERKKLIEEMRTTRVELGRESYLSMIIQSIEKSNDYIYFVSHTLTSSMPDIQKESLYKLYKKNVDHRCITGKDPGKIKYMWEQKRNGVDIRVNDLIMVSTFRFQVCGDRYSVLGFTESGDKKSRKGISIDNKYFTVMLKQYFLNLWENSIPIEEYIREIAHSMKNKAELNFSIKELVKEWNLTESEEKELEEIIGESSTKQLNT